jgi:putative CocE/NonD family hydrolase
VVVEDGCCRPGWVVAEQDGAQQPLDEREQDVGSRWYLQPEGGLGPQPVGHRAAPSRFGYDPADPTPNLGGPRLQGRRQVPQGALEARPDVLVFTGPVLHQPLEVIGPVQATIHLRSSVDQAQVFVRLCDVDATGRSWHVCDGIQRVDGVCWPADNDGVRRVQVRLFPTAHQFMAGHRLRAWSPAAPTHALCARSAPIRAGSVGGFGDLAHLP